MNGARRRVLAVLATCGCGLLAGGCAVSHEMATISPCGPPPGPHEITWYGPSAPRDRRAGDERCRTVGPPVVVPVPTASFDPLAPSDSLAVFSWNMDVGGGDLLAFITDAVGITCGGPESRASGAYPHVVVLLQEGFRRSADLPPLSDPRLAARRILHEPHPGGDLDVPGVAARCGLAAAYVPSGRNGADLPGEPRADKGNAILSTLPISDVLAVENPFETERKVAVAVSIQTPASGPLRLVNEHLEVTASFHRVFLTGNQTRTRQAEGFLEALAAQEEKEGRAPPTLVGGDFNTWSGAESTLRMMRRAFPDSPPWDGESTRGIFPTDHIFFRRGSSSIVLVPESYCAMEGSYSSDHRARFAWVRFGHESGGG
jgi:endonuclease/exonuclease/phosphatase family metal-dependent hydrolase